MKYLSALALREELIKLTEGGKKRTILRQQGVLVFGSKALFE
jgi:hypothetical protein